MKTMKVHLKPETESRLNELASQSGGPTGELVEDPPWCRLGKTRRSRLINVLDAVIAR
jgi:hypothetical protein